MMNDYREQVMARIQQADADYWRAVKTDFGSVINEGDADEMHWDEACKAAGVSEKSYWRALFKGLGVPFGRFKKAEVFRLAMMVESEARRSAEFWSGTATDEKKAAELKERATRLGDRELLGMAIDLEEKNKENVKSRKYWDEGLDALQHRKLGELLAMALGLPEKPEDGAFWVLHGGNCSSVKCRKH